MSIFLNRERCSLSSVGATCREAAREAAQLRVLMVNGWRLV